jgi:hypothetical protein
MSQESNHSHAHQDDNKVAVSFGASFWVVIILVGVFICAINFVKVMSSESGEDTKTEITKPASEAGDMKPNAAEAKAPAKSTEAGQTADSAKH